VGADLGPGGEAGRHVDDGSGEVLCHDEDDASLQ
jgi:hypothetical protein